MHCMYLQINAVSNEPEMALHSVCKNLNEVDVHTELQSQLNRVPSFLMFAVFHRARSERLLMAVVLP